jgi:nitroreductase
MEVTEAIKTRRSIRKYKATPVKDNDLDTILEAARWAPSWANTQCVRLVIVKDKEIKSKLAETLDSNNPAHQAILEAPILIAVCAELGKSGFRRGEIQTDKGDWYMFDAGIAMQNLVLASHSLGLGTVYVGLFDAPKAGTILNLPDEITVVALTPLGYPNIEPNTPQRKESSETVFYDSYSVVES